ncbi:hypothetical protein E4U19_004247 [Claviceps sp. Clav32 group G5]|nr:hypothetical protein E4U19_004247 [Claviceps sp. Clav32 group G5]KAG6041330.1 hypothetical protein E4U39_006609 [Claviceps sp. Clav50 group G5]
MSFNIEFDPDVRLSPNFGSSQALDFYCQISVRSKDKIKLHSTHPSRLDYYDPLTTYTKANKLYKNGRKVQVQQFKTCPISLRVPNCIFSTKEPYFWAAQCSGSKLRMSHMQ